VRGCAPSDEREPGLVLECGILRSRENSVREVEEVGERELVASEVLLRGKNCLISSDLALDRVRVLRDTGFNRRSAQKPDDDHAGRSCRTQTGWVLRSRRMWPVRRAQPFMRRSQGGGETWSWPQCTELQRLNQTRRSHHPPAFRGQYRTVQTYSGHARCTESGEHTAARRARLRCPSPPS
jgi:hypothetical protein